MSGFFGGGGASGSRLLDYDDTTAQIIGVNPETLLGALVLPANTLGIAGVAQSQFMVSLENALAGAEVSLILRVGDNQITPLSNAVSNGMILSNIPNLNFSLLIGCTHTILSGGNWLTTVSVQGSVTGSAIDLTTPANTFAMVNTGAGLTLELTNTNVISLSAEVTIGAGLIVNYTQSFAQLIGSGS